MAEDASSSSMYKMSPGKLQNIKKMFEERDSQANGPPIYGQSVTKQPIPILRTKPAKEIKPGAHSPVRQTWFASDTSAVSQQGDVRSSAARQRHFSDKQEWPALERIAMPSPTSATNPTVLNRLAHFENEGNKNVHSAGVVGPKSQQRHELDIAGSGITKQFNDLISDELVPMRHAEGGHKTAGSSLDPTCDFRASKVSDKLKLFESSKPSLPKKLVKNEQSILSASNATEKYSGCDKNRKGGKVGGEKVQDAYELPWDIKPSEYVKQLKKACNDRASSAVMIPVEDQTHQGLSAEMFSPPKAPVLQKVSRPTEQPPPPPVKPLRTFAHSDYLRVKSQVITHSKGAGIGGGQPEDSGEYNVSSMTGRISVLIDTDGGAHGDKQEGSAGGQYSHLGQEAPSVRKSSGVREKPPDRPPPPRPRPKSDGTALLHGKISENVKETNDSDSEGPVVISLKKGCKIGRQASMLDTLTRRNPALDRLPDIPNKEGCLQRFPLRKSFSSECLHHGSVSSLSESYDGSRGTMSRSWRRDDSGEQLYEALIDSGGYAVPHAFLRIDPAEQAADMDARPVNRPGFLKRVLLNAAKSPAAAEPPSVPKTTPVKDQDLDKVPRKKMNLVRQKINQAYEALQVVFNQPRPSASEEDKSHDNTDASSVDDHSTADSDSMVDIKEIKRRVTYCTSVRLRTHNGMKKTIDFIDKIYPQLFEYAVIVGLSARTDQPGFEPHVIYKFPQIADCNVSVAKFCFPDADEFKPGTVSSSSESYSFVLTNLDGGRTFGYCRRIQPRGSSLPEVICIISPVDAFNMYNKLLTEIESQRQRSLDLAQELIAASFGRPLPRPGKVCHIRSLNEAAELETIFLERPSDNRLSNVNYELLLQHLGTDKLIRIFASMLMERRIILCSSHLSTLTQSVHALVALLYPFTWQHVYIPLLPPDMLEVCAAPLPFIVGVMQAHLPRVLSLELEDMIVVDLDRKLLLRSMGDEMTLLPRKVQKALKTAINMCHIDSDAQNSQWLMISEAFLRMFLETVGHFTQHISTQQDGTKTLLKEKFIAAAPSRGIRQFLEWFTETQMFEVFISMHLEKQNWGGMELFNQRLGELHTRSQAKGLGQKVKDLGKAIKSRLKEAT